MSHLSPKRLRNGKLLSEKNSDQTGTLSHKTLAGNMKNVNVTNVNVKKAT